MRLVRRLVALLVALCLTLLTLLLLAGHGPWAGDVLWAYDANHGLNQGDLPVLGVWLVGMLGCGWLFVRPGRP